MHNEYQAVKPGEYVKGAQLPAHFNPSKLANGYPMPFLPDESNGLINLEIINALNSFINTVPCVVRQVVTDPYERRSSSIASPPRTRPETLYLVKLYDRRHFNLDRNQGGHISDWWNEDRARLYQQYLPGGGAESIDFEDDLEWLKPYRNAHDGKCRGKAEAVNVGTRASDIELDDLKLAEVVQPFIGLAEAAIAYQAEKR